MRITSISIIALVVLCSCKAADDPERNPDSGKKIIEQTNPQSELPNGLYSYISTELPDFSLVKTSEYISELSNFLEKDSQPYFCRSDFDGNGQNDYAILLWENESTICIIVFNSVDNGYNYQTLECFEKTKGSLDIVLSTEPKGEWSSIDETIDVPYDGILVEFLEESHSYSYYWKNDSFLKYLYD